MIYTVTYQLNRWAETMKQDCKSGMQAKELALQILLNKGKIVSIINSDGREFHLQIENGNFVVLMDVE